MFKVIHKSVPFSSSGGGPTTVRTVVEGLSSGAPQTIFIVLRGFDIGYDHGDHHLREIIIQPRLTAPDAVGRAELVVEAGVRDASGNWDDPYSGHVDVDIVIGPDSAVAITSTLLFQEAPHTRGPVTVRDDLKNSFGVSAGMPTAAFLTGFRIGFTSGDHHVQKMHLGAHFDTVHVSGQTLRVATGKLGLRDSSGDWDDAYGGSVEVTLVHLADALASVSTVGPNMAYVVDTKADPVGSPPTTVGSGPLHPTTPVALPRNAVGDPVIGLRAFELGFGNGDHHLGRVWCRCTPSAPIPSPTPVGGPTVKLTWELGIRDLSGNWDDPYYGAAAADVIAVKGT